MPADWLPAAKAAVLSAVGTLRPSGDSPSSSEAAHAVVLSAVGTPASRTAGTQDLQPNPAPAVLARLATLPYRMSTPTRFDLRQQWEGIVVSVSGDSFTATLKDLTDPSVAEESSELFLEDVGESDRELVELGAVFYWSVGYEDTPRGRERKSIIRFRRLPGWSGRQLDSVNAETAELSDYFLRAPSNA